MKKTICVILVIFITIITCIFMNYKQIIKNQNEAKSFNKEFEFYDKESVLGVDITTVINKAMDNNETHNIEKDEKGRYIDDGEYCIKVYVYMIINEETYSMEHIVKTGLEKFTQYFGEINFKCTGIEYHENGRISSISFASTEY